MKFGRIISNMIVNWLEIHFCLFFLMWVVLHRILLKAWGINIFINSDCLLIFFLRIFSCLFFINLSVFINRWLALVSHIFTSASFSFLLFLCCLFYNWIVYLQTWQYYWKIGFNSPSPALCFLIFALIWNILGNWGMRGKW